MRWKRGSDENSLRCSFCHKSQEAAGRLISNPSDYARAYICDECIAICASTAVDDRAMEEPETAVDIATPHPLLRHPLASELMEAIEAWIRQESLGNDALEEILEVRRIAGGMVGKT